MNLLLIAPDKSKQNNKVHSDWFPYLSRYCDYRLYDVNVDLDIPNNISLFLNQNRRDIRDIISEYDIKFDAILIYTFRYSVKAIDFKSFEKINIPVFGFIVDAWNREDFNFALSEFKNFRGIFTRYHHGFKFIPENIKSKLISWSIEPNRKDLKFVTEKEYDITTLGRINNDLYPNREKIYKLIQESNYKSFLPEDCKMYSLLPYEQYIDVIGKSKIAIFTSSIYQYALMKVFESMVKGTLLFYDECPEMKLLGFEEGKHYVKYRNDLGDLKEKIDYYLKNENERKEIINNAYNFVVNNYNVDGKVKEMVEFIKNGK